ncbi:DUF72 domain-containing protein [Paraliomyxa miuraensis]|uniref:DUF72 domain-containing protein n=1 Tax=Paraliomyxa miuraensis TaxID=376150 RepID=UPI00224DB5F5|nr:DUF72 domain-containing protein [Paraliomyxa miuraensis]MCX4244121.1 DUF72 domain-containing protein [Paraliomyxa miuraensis]
MRLRVGTSGYAYDEWDGGFYPAGLSNDERLSFYAERFGTVEINNTFYRMPKRAVLRRWAEAVPDGFDFVIKASRRITHEARLKNADEGVAILLRQLEALGDKRGPILFQTPPFLPRDVERLRTFVGLLPAGVRAAFELRHRGWDDPLVHEVLADAGHAWCVAELEGDAAKHGEDAGPPASDADPSSPATDPERMPPLVRTAPWGYVRLHDSTYDDQRLRRWAERIRDTWDEAWVFFSHEQTAPTLVQRMIAIARTLPGIELPGAWSS